MANYAPTVNTRGMIYTHGKGLVLRTTYHVFDLFVNHTGPTVLDATVQTPQFMVKEQMGIDVPVPHVDAVATLDPGRNTVHVSLLNFHRERAIDMDVRVSGVSLTGEAQVRRLTGDTPDSFNDVGHPDRVRIIDESITAGAGGFTVTCPPHTVMAVTCRYK
jgi:alpha-L-arabinofuranosidase